MACVGQLLTMRFLCEALRFTLAEMRAVNDTAYVTSVFVWASYKLKGCFNWLRYPYMDRFHPQAKALKFHTHFQLILSIRFLILIHENKYSEFN